MKKIMSITLILAVTATLAACGATSKIPTESVVSTSEETQRLAFGKVLWDIYQQGVLPDGDTLDYIDMESAASNSFAVIDIDNDGQDELLLLWENASTMAGRVGFVFGYDDGVVHTELEQFPSQTFYDNGIVEVGWSHNSGLSGKFWAYNVYCYDAKSDTYQSFGGIDALDKRILEGSGKDDFFPMDIDADGDGLVYYIHPANWNGQYDNIPLVDGADYEKWRNAYIDEAEEIDISFQKLTEENIAALGYSKPDISLPQPVG